MKRHITFYGSLIVIISLLVPGIVGCFSSKNISRSKAELHTTTSSPDSAHTFDTLNQNVASQNKDSSLTDLNKSLSGASQLLIRACENYLIINPESPKSNEVLTIMASLFFNTRAFQKSRDIYKKIIDKFPGTLNASDAMKMIAQTYYEEKNYEEAQQWYRKISETASDGVNKQEALARIAESIFRMAELHEENGRLKDAAESYERAALEFPDSRIADVALFNAGLAYEKQAEWTHAILIFQRLSQKYPNSKLIPKTQFRIARSHEKMSQWEIAAQSYLRVVASFPRDELAQTAMYNAGFCFENGNLFPEAAATFEKMIQLYPDSDDAADVLFRAGEIYGKIKDWESVGRVNKIFAARYGNDKDRIIQVQCMTGIALYMQNNDKDALVQLEKTLTIFASLADPSTMNTYYAAKAVFTIGEIHHEAMKKIRLPQSKVAYKKLLTDKSALLDLTTNAYAKVIQFKIMEWTTRAIFQLGQAHEDFGVGIFNQERPLNQTLDERILLELGIAQAVEQYFVDKALHYHEQNVKLALNEKIEDKHVLLSRRKLTYLPLIAAENYISLVEISRGVQEKVKQEGFVLIARKLQVLQQIAPFQERAIDLLLKSLEIGSTYTETDDFFKKASATITGISFTVGETYSDIVTIARDAPIPTSFDDYERFVYKTKLIKQIEGYEDQALTNHLKTLKIADAYTLDDESVRKTRGRIAEVLFNRARCYDLLCLTAFNKPPYPPTINVAEREEYKIRFEEIGLKFQEQAFDIYRTILTYAKQNYSSGPFVTHAYVRLFQNFPEEFGTSVDELVNTVISSGSQWQCTTDSNPDWQSFEYNDSTWKKAQSAGTIMLDSSTRFPGTIPPAMWYGEGDPAQMSTYVPAQRVFFRRTFTTSEMPRNAFIYFTAFGRLTLFVNGKFISTDTCTEQFSKLITKDLMGKMRSGKNCLAFVIDRDTSSIYGIKPLIILTTGTKGYQPVPPGFQEPLASESVRVDIYNFPKIKNFEME